LTRGAAPTENRFVPRIAGVLALALIALPVSAAAQVSVSPTAPLSPTAPVHPNLPWSGITTPQGQLLRYIFMPPQPVTLEYVVMGPAETPPPAPEAPPASAEAETPPAPPAEGEAPAPQIVRQQVIVPGFYVRETTVGYHYPERWAIEQAAPNVYRWRQLPAQFVPK